MAHSRWVRVVWGTLLLLWLGAEDTHTLPVALLGASGALLSVGGALARAYAGQWQACGALLPTASGGLIGAAGALLTTFLMFFKNSWHAHPFPDYPLSMLLDMLGRAPVWAAAGALLGGAWWLWRG